MFNFTNRSKFVSNLSKMSFVPTFATALQVAGFSTGAVAPLSYKIFLQPSNTVYGPGGVEHDIVVCATNNEEYAKQYGAFFFLAGKDFMKLSNREQLASIAYELTRIADNGAVCMMVMNAGLAKDGAAANDLLSKVYQHVRIINANGESQISTDTEIIAPSIDAVTIQVAIGAIYGADVAKKICDKYAKRIRTAAMIDTKEICKQLKSAGITFAAAKDAVKAAKKANKTAVADTKVTQKAAKQASATAEKAAKKDIKAECKAGFGAKATTNDSDKTAENDPLSAMGEDIPVDVVVEEEPNDGVVEEGPNPAAAAC